MLGRLIFLRDKMVFSLRSSREQYKSLKESKLVQYENQQEPTRSLPFQTLIERLPKDRKLRIIVFGSARESLFRFFSENHPCKIWFYPLDRFLEEVPERCEDESLKQWADRLFSDFPDEPLDAVLVWDALNYFDTDFLQALSLKIHEIQMKPCYLLASLSTRPKLPEHPLAVDVIDREHLRYSGWDQIERKNALISLRELSEYFPGSKNLRSGLLRNGLQEVLFQL